MIVRFASCLAAAALALLASCTENAPSCADGFVRGPSGCVPDPVDAGRDAAPHDGATPADGGPCDPPCEGGRICAEVDEGAFACVECTTDAHCGGGHCNGENRCVECTENAHCPDPAAAQCGSGGTCVPCTMDEHCPAERSICDTSRSPATCVECTRERSECTGSETCDVFAGACVAVGPRSRGNCQTCTNDLQCQTDYRCIQMEYPVGTARETGHCLRRETAGCANPYRFIIHRGSVSGAAAENYCGIDEARTTCEAVLALEADADCTTDGSCIIGGSDVPVPGAICRRVSGTDGKCTYECAGPAAHCPTGIACGGTGQLYCGGT